MKFDGQSAVETTIMANFRGEKFLIRISESIDGFDPNMGIDPGQLSHVAGGDCHSFTRTPLADFACGPGSYQRPRWFKAAKGLKSVRGLIAEMEQKLQECQEEERKAWMERDLSTLRILEDRLDTIDVHDCKFYFHARD